MMNQIAQATAARLLEQMPDFTVEPFPSAPDRYPFTTADQTLLVSYESSSFASLESFAPMSVERTGLVAVTLLTRSLDGDQGIIASVEAIVKALFGWRPSRDGVPLGASPMQPVRDAFVAEDNGTWRWVVEFSTRTMVVAETTPLAGPPLTDVKLIPRDESEAA